MDPAARALARIKAAQLSAELYRTARELLDLAANADGNIKISKRAMMDICQTTADGTMRRQLGALKRKGIVHVSTNEYVYVSFVDFPAATEPRAARAPEITRRAPEITARAPVITARADATGAKSGGDLTARARRAPVITGRARTRARRALPHTRVLVGCLVDQPIHPESEQPTNHGSPNSPNSSAAPVTDTPHPPVPAAPPPPDAPGTAISPAEQARTVAMLTDPAVAVGVKRARLLAAEHSFEYARRVVAMFWDRLQSGAVKAGKVITALDDRWGAPALDDHFTATDYYRRHRTPDEIADDEAAAAALAASQPDPDPEPDAASSATTPPAEPQPDDASPELRQARAVWRQVQTELAIEQGGSFDRWLHDTWVIAYEQTAAGAEFLIGLPDAFRLDWIVHRLSRQIKRKLSVILGHQVDVQFRVQPRPLATNGINS